MKKHTIRANLNIGDLMISANAALLSDDPIDLSSYGIDCVKFAIAESYLQSSNPSVLGAHFTPGNYQSLISLMLKEKRRSSNKRFLVFYERLSKEQLIEIYNLIHPAHTEVYSLDNNFAQSFAECFSDYYQLEQNKQLIDMVNEKNEELKKLTISLENKIEERQLDLEKSRLKNIYTENKLKVLEKLMVQIYHSSSINEIEHGVTEILKKEFNIKFVQIRQLSQTSLNKKIEGLKSYKKILKSQMSEFGHIIFYKEDNSPFDKNEKKFLNQVAEAVSLSIERTFQNLKSLELKKQWEATFDAILDPICLTDKDYNILRINARFLEKTNTTDYNQSIGKKCYETLFNRETPCEGCQRGEVFQLRNPAQKEEPEVFDVYSNNLGENRQAIYFQMYRDVTRDLNLQRQVIESAKMAELGTISSSIAHELNNPIGGMLNFIQLMKMDLEGTEDFYSDILEIEKGIIKCKNIVKNLLGFARKSFNDEIDTIQVSEVIDQAIKITELKTRSIGIKINFNNQSPEATINGRFNLLTHAIRNILQNSQESLIEMRSKDKSFHGEITIDLLENEKQIELEIVDNGKGISEGIKSKVFDPLFTTKDPETNSGLGLTLALQIVKEHNGTISITTDKDKKLSVKLIFFKSEVQSGPSEF